MIADNIGLAMAVSLSYACRNDPRARQLLPLLAFPLLATGDLCSIYRELKSIHLRNLNKERAEIVAEMWLDQGRIPSAAEVPASVFCLAVLFSTVSGSYAMTRAAPLVLLRCLLLCVFGCAVKTLSLGCGSTSIASSCC